MEERKMTPLEDLEREFPVVDAAFRRFCASHGIFSVEDFSVSDVYLLAALADRHPNPAALKEGITRLLSTIDQRHQPWRNGVELLDASASSRFLCTGFPGIDALLRGGLREGELTELVGPSSSGKTQVCLCAASRAAECGVVVFLDTGNSFSSQRIASFASGMASYLDKQVMEERMKRILGKIFCSPVYDIFSLLKILGQLDFALKQQGDH